MIKAVIISNSFYVSRLLMDTLDLTEYKIVFEESLDKDPRNKLFLRLRAFFPCKPSCESNVIVFSIENVIVLDYVYRNVGKPKVWLWNPISSMTKKNKMIFLAYIRQKKIEVWTFDIDDSNKYGFIHHHQIHASTLISNNITGNGDIFFSGVDKGRLETIKKIKNDLKDLFASIVFHVVRDKKRRYSNGDLFITTNAYLNFSDYLKKVSDCSVLVDVSQENQSGITLRVVESLFMNKKLISTNFKIKELDFYHPDNIYLYGLDKRTLEAFLTQPLYKINNEIKHRYTLEHLLKEML